LTQSIILSQLFVMSLRVYKAVPTYSSYISSFYKAHPHLCKASFNEQLEALKQDCFQWILCWNKYNKDPNMFFFETVPNDYYLQKAWLKDGSAEEDWEKTIVFEQIKAFKPHICILYSPEVYNTAFINRLKELDRSIIIGGYDGMDRQNISLYEGYDFVITCSEYISKYYEGKGMDTFVMRFGFDPEILNKTIRREKRYQTSFTGSVFPGVHDDRFDLLSYLGRKTTITIGSDYGYSPNGLLSRRVLRQIKSLPFIRIPDYLRLYRHNVGPLFGLEMFQFLRDSAVSLNMHGDRIQFAANIRLFEATGIGSCLLTDWKENISELFEPEKEILTYHTKEEALDKVRFCIKKPSYSETIAKNGQRRTLTEYSYDRIVPEVIQFVKQEWISRNKCR